MLSFNSQNQQSQSRLSKLKKPLLIIVVAGVFYAAGFFTQPANTLYKSQAVNQSAHTYIANILSGNVVAAYNESSSAVKGKETQDQFTKALSGLKISESPNYKNQKTTINNNVAFYIAQVTNLPKTTSGNTTGTFSLSLIKQDNKWVVDGISVQ